MHESLRILRNAQLGSMLAPRIRFFEPKSSFFKALSSFKHLLLIDAGTGLGKVPEEARTRGFKMLGIDILPRTGQSESVVFMEAESYPYNENTWVLMCRPDHSGWAYDTLENALRSGAGAFYVGLERNLEIDLGDYVGRHSQCWKNVGKQGEDMFLYMPENLLPTEIV